MPGVLILEALAQAAGVPSACARRREGATERRGSATWPASSARASGARSSRATSCG
jgi:3-hydroxymyristoyl/3-hydroxydecanoyl-(acyl carrier protein) dehydratase